MKKIILLAIFVVVALAGCSHAVTNQSEATFSSNQIDREKIRRVVQSHLTEMKDCYLEALKKNKDLAGKIVLQWTIGGFGKVSEVKIKSSTLNSPEAENCSIAKLKSWTFPSPPPAQEAVISYPFVFQSVDD